VIGIKSYGAYVPRYRLSRDEIAAGLGIRSGGGEIAVAGFDQDSLTLSVEAVLDCLKGTAADSIDGLFLASTTFPYDEKQSAVIAAMAADLKPGLMTSDFSGSLRCGSIALMAAMDSVKAGSAKSIIVAGAAARLGAPSSAAIQTFGDGAAAFVITADDPLVSVEAAKTYSAEFFDYWRTKDDRFVRSHDPAFMRQYGYVKTMTEAVPALLAEGGWSSKDFAKVIYSAYDQRSHQDIARRLGFDQAQVQDPLFQTVGHTGCASALMGLAAALAEAREGDLLLLANYGDGCDSLVLKVRGDLTELNKSVSGVQGWLAQRAEMKFHQYLRFRDLLPKEM